MHKFLPYRKPTYAVWKKLSSMFALSGNNDILKTILNDGDLLGGAELANTFNTFIGLHRLVSKLVDKLKEPPTQYSWSPLITMTYPPFS